MGRRTSAAVGIGIKSIEKRGRHAQKCGAFHMRYRQGVQFSTRRSLFAVRRPAAVVRLVLLLGRGR